MLLADPLIDLRSFDVVTDRNNIRKLLSFVDPGTTRNGAEDFAIKVEIVGETALFSREEKPRWLSAFNSGNETTLLAYHEANFPYDVASRHVSSITNECALRSMTGGFEFKDADNGVDEYGFTATLKEAVSVQFASVRIRVNTIPPHGVIKFDIGPTHTPEKFLSSEEREARMIDETQRYDVVTDLSQKLKDNYVSESVAAEMSKALHSNLDGGRYNTLNDTAELAEALMRDIRGVYDDKHMGVFFLWRPRDERKPPSEDEVLDRLRCMGFGIGETKRHAHGIASIELLGFVPSDQFAEVAEYIATRMSAIANASALIVDLRHNGSGDPCTVSLIASYLFSQEKVHLNDIYDPETGEKEGFWTDPSVAGTKFGDMKPVYILTSNTTISGGEEFAYDLQALKRATLVGETTAGAGNLPRPFELQHRLVASIPTKYPVNPITGRNWEGTGVVPEIKVVAKDAFVEAYRKAKQDLGVGGEGNDEAETFQDI